MLKEVLVRLSVVAFVCCLSMSAHAMADQKSHVNVPAGDLTAGLELLAKQSGAEFVYRADQLKGLRTRGVAGDLSPKEAVTQLLIGTPLQLRMDPSGAMLIAPARANSTSDASSAAGSEQTQEGKSNSSGGFLLAQATPGQTPSNVPVEQPEEQPSKKRPVLLEEILVTGTSIPGAAPTSSVLTIDRNDIDRSGAATVGGVMKTVPQNFGGGQNIGSIDAQGSNNTGTVSQGSTANLRGLGSESTLSLVNGHRLAYDGNSNAADISIIPLSAVERIEVVTDGASAIYGSDAIAGVVNFILRHDFDGAETHASVGRATSGGDFSQQYDQLLGKTWQSGNVLVDYQYAKNDAVFASQRSFTSAPAPTPLLPSANKNSLFLTVSQDLSGNASVFVEGLYTNRSANTLAADTSGTIFSTDYDVVQYGLVEGVNIDLSNGWRVSVSGDEASSRDKNLVVAQDGSQPSQTAVYRNQLDSAEIKTTGPLVTLPSGDTDAAFGAGYRKEQFSLVRDVPVINTSHDRDVKYVYGELLVPLVKARSGREGLQTLNLSVAGRYEDYSDFGGTTNPKVGLLYVPTTELTLRTSWGTSFRAPQLYQKYAAPLLILFNLPDPASPTGTTTTFVQVGPNPALGPEKARTWTTGLEYGPSWLKGFTANLDYFSIDYRDRVSLPSLNLFAAYTNPSLAPFVTRNPSAALQAQVIAAAGTFLNFSGAPYDPATVGGLFDDRYQNLNEQWVHGVDVLLKYMWSLLGGNFDASLNATYLNARQRLLAGQPKVTISATVFNPPKFRARGGLTWARNGWSASAFVNYLGAETDPYESTPQPISSWTTVDAQISYRFQGGGKLKGLRVDLSASNLFNKDPPFVGSAAIFGTGINFDSTNASGLGRFVSINVVKSW